MLTFKQAKRRHDVLARVITDENDALAEAIYAGVTGVGASKGGNMTTLAVADTMPMDFAVLLGTEDIPASFATSLHLKTLAEFPAPRSPHEARRIAAEAWRRFTEFAAHVADREYGRGFDDSDPWETMVVVQQIQPDPEKMRRIAELAGRMYQALRGAKDRRVAGVPEEVVGTETGGDVAALLPSEWAMLATDPTKRHLFGQIAERRALQYERRGVERKGRGPLVVALDESGSMEGDRNEWAKAAMTALTRIAWEEKRPVVVVHFSTATKTQVLKPGNVAGLVKAQHMFLNGGTVIGRALMVGVDEVKALAASGHKGADVVLVSDGTDGGEYVAEALAEMKAIGSRLWSVAIDCEFTGPLRDEASAYIHLSDADMRSGAAIKKVGGAVL